MREEDLFRLGMRSTDANHTPRHPQQLPVPSASPFALSAVDYTGGGCGIAPCPTLSVGLESLLHASCGGGPGYDHSGNFGDSGTADYSDGDA